MLFICDFSGFQRGAVRKSVILEYFPSSLHDLSSTTRARAVASSLTDKGLVLFIWVIPCIIFSSLMHNIRHCPVRSVLNQAVLTILSLRTPDSSRCQRKVT
jgi:hypothetical protein